MRKISINSRAQHDKNTECTQHRLTFLYAILFALFSFDKKKNYIILYFLKTSSRRYFLSVLYICSFHKRFSAIFILSNNNWGKLFTAGEEGYDHMRFAFLNWLESQSNPSYNPSPLVAQVACMYQFRLRNEWRPNLSVISAAFIAFGKS